MRLEEWSDLVPGTRKIFSDNLRKARQRKGLTIEQMANRLEIVVGTVYRWEKGINFPGPEELDRLSEILGLTVAQFFADESEDALDAVEIVNTLSDLMRRLSKKHNS